LLLLVYYVVPYLVYCVERFIVFAAWVLPAGAIDPSTCPPLLYVLSEAIALTVLLALAWLVITMVIWW
jgi:hypothetical protein